MPTPASTSAPAFADLFARGRAANAAGRPVEGERLLRAAWRALAGWQEERVPGFPSLGDQDPLLREVQVRVLLSLSTALIQHRGLEAALSVAREATELVESSTVAELPHRSALLGMCRSQLAMIYGRSGRLDEALTQLDRAMARERDLGAHERFMLRLSRGVIRMDQGDLGGAETDCAEAASIAAAAGLGRQEFMARHNLAIVASLRGDLSGALQIYREIERLPQHAEASAATALHGRARTLLEAGLVGEAVDLLERAAADAAGTGQRLVAGEVQVDLAYAELVDGRPEAAAASAGRARRLLQGRAPGLRRRAELVLLDARRRRGRRLGAVVTEGRDLVDAFDRDGDHVAADLARLVVAEALIDQARAEEALRTLRQMADLTAVGSLSTRLRARGVLAAAARAADDPATARRHLRAALTDLTEAIGASSSLEMRAATHLYAQDLASLDVQIAAGHPKERLLAVERWREAASRTPAVRPPRDPELARRVAVLRHLRNQLREDPSRADALRPRLRALERSVASLSWSAPGRDGQRRMVTREDLAEAVQQLSGAGTTLACLVEEGGRLGAVVVGSASRRTRLVDLGPGEPVRELARRVAVDLETAARACGGPMEQVLQTSLRRSVDQLDAVVLRPLGLEGRVLVVPTSALAAVPWGMLPSRRGRPTPVAPSLSAWAQRPTQLGSPRVITLAGPQLAQAQTEARTVSAAWPGGRVLPEATGTDLSAALADHDLVHVAAHGRHRDDSPLFSSLGLHDGPCFLADLEQGAVRASHVVLSACDSGRARHRGGSAALGLAAGLLSLGVGTVVAAACRIPDDVAAEHMPRYHALLADGIPADEALSAAAETSHLMAGAFVAWGAPWSVRTMPG